MKNYTSIFFAVVAAMLTCAPHMSATEVVNTDYHAWLATVSGSASEWDFNIPSNTYDAASGYSLNVGSFGPLTVTGPDGGGYILNKNPGYGPGNYTTLEGASDGIGSMMFTTPAAGLTAFGLGIGESGSAAPITLTLSDGETFTLNPTVGGSIFEGLSSATPITSFVMTTTSGSEIELTDFLAGVSNEQANTIPSTPAVEVATAVMIGSGLFFLFFGARRKVFSNLSKPKLHTPKSIPVVR